MRLSKKKINRNVGKLILAQLYGVVADIRSATEAEVFLKEVLTKTELEALAKRLAVAHYLAKGGSYDDIKNTLKVSSATVATIAEQLKKNGGFKIALKKIEADQWAEKWSKKISTMMGKSHE